MISSKKTQTLSTRLLTAIKYNVIAFFPYRNAGAYGSRLTGAGWGGCTVSLVSAGNVNHFIQCMKAEYYDKKSIRPASLSDVIFASSPGSGAKIIENIVD